MLGTLVPFRMLYSDLLGIPVALVKSDHVSMPAFSIAWRNALSFSFMIYPFCYEVGRPYIYNTKVSSTPNGGARGSHVFRFVWWRSWHRSIIFKKNLCMVWWCGDGRGMFPHLFPHLFPLKSTCFYDGLFTADNSKTPQIVEISTFLWGLSLVSPKGVEPLIQP